MKAIKTNKARGKSTDFWSLPLPQETKQYVPKMLALE
ncbi:membrane-bound lytic murein transglycosylase D [Escherichia coli]|uniref:Membrane-bound lytic murein transglycosylase D n=1 Tax=Escherichia coli TaxID=562 RepID=A0A376MRH5_ECOLX|nr:membrane-bound lytic murein transglycosylase D [Escherichia coli]